MANENRAILPPCSGDVSLRPRLFYLFLHHQLHSGAAPFHIGLRKRLSKSLQGSLASLRGCIVLGFLDTNTPAVPYVRYNSHELLAARVPLLLLLPRTLPLYFLEKLHPRTFARTRIRYSPLARIYSTGYRARGTYCRGVFGAISFCFRNVLRASSKDERDDRRSIEGKWKKLGKDERVAAPSQRAGDGVKRRG